MAGSQTTLEFLTDLHWVSESRSCFSGSTDEEVKKWYRKAQDKGSLSESHRKLDLGSGQGGAVTDGDIWSW